MNTQNVGSLEACKRLLDAGIVLETDCYWHFNGWKYEWQLKYRDYFIENWGLVPAPSMAEVWRELPEYIANDRTIQYLEMGKTGSKTYAVYDFADNYILFDNPTDALIDLLIYIKKEKI